MNKMDPYPLPVFAVFDPDCERWKPWTEVLNTDCVEVESHRFVVGDHWGPPIYRLKMSSLGPDQLAGICRLFAQRTAGIDILAHGIFVCQDPDLGRRYYAQLRQKGGGR